MYQISLFNFCFHIIIIPVFQLASSHSTASLLTQTYCFCYLSVWIVRCLWMFCGSDIYITDAAMVRRHLQLRYNLLYFTFTITFYFLLFPFYLDTLYALTLDSYALLTCASNFLIKSIATFIHLIILYWLDIYSILTSCSL